MKTLRKAVLMGRIFMGYRARRGRLRTMPIRIWIETSSVCNLRCVMCPNKSMPAADKGLMDVKLFRKVIDEVRDHVQDVYLHHRGEPLMHPDLFDMVSYAEKAGIRTRFHTNGTLLTEEKARMLLDAGPSLVSFSIDGVDGASYEAIRVGASLKKTVGNVIGFLDLRRQRGSTKPYVVVERIRFKNSAGSYSVDDEPVRRLREAGVDEVIEKEEYAWSIADDAPVSPVPGPGVCTFPWYATVICWNGKVLACPQDYAGKLEMGNVAESSIAEIWNGQAYRDLRRRLAGDLSSLALCRGCDRLRRKTIAGIPWQYMLTFLTDQYVGYNSRLRRLIGTAERN